MFTFPNVIKNIWVDQVIWFGNAHDIYIIFLTVTDINVFNVRRSDENKLTNKST